MKRLSIVEALLPIALALAIDNEYLTAQPEVDPSAVTLPLEIEINGVSKGEAIVRATPSLDFVELQGGLLRDLLSEVVAEELNSLVENLPDNFVSLEQLRELGLEIELDLERLVITLSIQQRHTSREHNRNSISLGYQRALRYDTHATEATFSGYANLRWLARRSESGDATRNISHSLGIQHALNLGGWALEGDSVWNERDGFETRQLRLVHDFPDRLCRLSVGDISTPIADLQRGSQLFGLNLVKEFGIRPYQIFTPTSSASFQLDEASTVTVNINGRTTKTLRLEAGQYDIEEFKLAAGENNMRLEIESESGLRDSISITEFASMSLLGKGVSTYALSFGWPRATASAQNSKQVSSLSWYQRHVQDSPLLSGYYRRGLGQQITSTLDFQANDEWSRAGLGLATAGEFLGEFDASVSYNQSLGNPDGFSARVRWSKTLAGISFAANSVYSAPGFRLTEPEQLITPRDVEFSHSLRLAKRFREKLDLSFSAYHQIRYNGSTATSANGNIGRRFGPLYASATLQYSNEFDQEKIGAFVNLTWNPAPKWRARSRGRYDNVTNSMEFTSSVDYSNRSANRFTNASINARHDADGYSFDGNLALRTSSYGVQLSHRELYNAIDDYVNRGRETSLGLESAIAFADGAFGFAHSIRDSFAIVHRHKAWRDVRLGINPTLGGYEKTAGGAFGSPVLSNLSSYREGYATIETIDSVQFLERNDYYFFPSYRRGTRLQIGDNAIYSLRSTLYASNGEPVAYQALHLKRNGQDPISAFTNKTGRFVVSGLEPGRYTVKIAGSSETAEILIDEGEPFIFVERVDMSY